MSRPLPKLLAVACAACVAAATADPLPETEIAALLEARVKDNHGTAIVAGVIDRQGRRFFRYGPVDRKGGPPADARTVFPIASVTKVLTSWLLADMALKGEVALDDPVQQYLPSGVTAPVRDGQAIRLIHLATHTAGLPVDFFANKGSSTASSRYRSSFRRLPSSAWWRTRATAR